MSERPFFLDTNVVLTLVRGNSLARDIDERFSLQASEIRPMVSIVSHGEVRVLARRNNWGEEKLTALQTALDNLVTVNIHHPDVLDAYVELDLYSQRSAMGARNMGKNDLWIAACAKAAGARLLTTDKDFDHLAGSMLILEFIDPASIKAC